RVGERGPGGEVAGALDLERLGRRELRQRRVQRREPGEEIDLLVAEDLGDPRRGDLVLEEEGGALRERDRDAQVEAVGVEEGRGGDSGGRGARAPVLVLITTACGTASTPPRGRVMRARRGAESRISARSRALVVGSRGTTVAPSLESASARIAKSGTLPSMSP